MCAHCVSKITNDLYIDICPFCRKEIIFVEEVPQGEPTWFIFRAETSDRWSRKVTHKELILLLFFGQGSEKLIHYLLKMYALGQKISDFTFLSTQFRPNALLFIDGLKFDLFHFKINMKEARVPMPRNI